MTIPEISIDDLGPALDDGAPLVDVRNVDEYAGGHIPGAYLIPLHDLDDRLADLPSGRPLHVVCKSGARSTAAVEKLRDRGIDAVSVAGGTDGWIASGRHTRTGQER